MKYICDTAKECGHKKCEHQSHSDEMGCDIPFYCHHVLHRVRCKPVEAHTCYFCDHTGTDVNRIATYLGIRSTDYCCDDAVACDERWEALETDKEAQSLERKIYAIIDEEALNHVTNEKIATESTNRIMKLIELPF